MLRLLLYPLSFLYSGITGLRNILYDLDIRKSVKFEANVISVGNMEVGGTGKTPMIAYLIDLFKANYNVATLSRGYKRKSKGFRIITDNDDASTAGDEPYQFYCKYKQEITVAVSKERETAIPFILAENPETDIILLDDAYQYRTVRPSLSILLTRYDRLFYEDRVMPSGRLRERKNNINRADIVVVTKCIRGMNELEMEEIEKNIRKFSFNGSIFFTTIKYGKPIPIFHSTTFTPNILLVSGIAHPETLEEYIENTYNLLGHIQYEDHHFYTDDDIDHIHDIYKGHSAKNDISVIITEKDAAKWKSEKIKKLVEFMPVFYLPIEPEFLKKEKEFQDILMNSVKEYRN